MKHFFTLLPTKRLNEKTSHRCDVILNRSLEKLGLVSGFLLLLIKAEMVLSEK